jgi:hypothetical protein
MEKGLILLDDRSVNNYLLRYVYTIVLAAAIIELSSLLFLLTKFSAGLKYFI